MADRLGSGRDETEYERLDRNLQELLGELRVALRGVQVLFAGAASALLIAPPAAHRITFRHQEKNFIVRWGNNLTIAGLGCLAVSMTAAIGLVVDVVFSAVVAVASAALIGSMFAVLWYIVPLRQRK